MRCFCFAGPRCALVSPPTPALLHTDAKHTNRDPLSLSLRSDAAALAPLSAAGAPLASAAAVVLPALAGGGVSDLFTNRVFLAGFWAWFCAQTLKIFTKRLKKGVWDVRAIVDSGGMPSSHSALCAGVTTAIAFQPGLGFGSAAFAVAVAFSAIVMYDAAGVRRHAGERRARMKSALFVCMRDLYEVTPCWSLACPLPSLPPLL